jgi:hypothetical protein
MKESKFSLRKGFQGIKNAATSLTSPRNVTGKKKNKEIDSATNFIEKNIEAKIEQHDIDFLFVLFDHPRSEFALKKQYGKKIKSLSASAMTMSGNIEMQRDFKRSFDILQAALRYTLRDNCTHYDISIEEALDAFDSPENLDELNKRKDAIMDRIGNDDVTSKAYYAKAYGVAEGKIEAPAKQVDADMCTSLKTLGIDKKTFAELRYLSQQCHVATKAYKDLSRKVHPDKNPSGTIQQGREHEPALEPFIGQDPTEAFKAINHAYHELLDALNGPI